jgi:hypothetical protein
MTTRRSSSVDLSLVPKTKPVHWKCNEIEIKLQLRNCCLHFRIQGVRAAGRPVRTYGLTGSPWLSVWQVPPRNVMAFARINHRDGSYYQHVIDMYEALRDNRQELASTCIINDVVCDICGCIFCKRRVRWCVGTCIVMIASQSMSETNCSFVQTRQIACVNTMPRLLRTVTCQICHFITT